MFTLTDECKYNLCFWASCVAFIEVLTAVFVRPYIISHFSLNSFFLFSMFFSSDPIFTTKGIEVGKACFRE